MSPRRHIRKLAGLFRSICEHASEDREASVGSWLKVETVLLKKMQIVKSPNELRGISILATFAKYIVSNMYYAGWNTSFLSKQNSSVRLHAWTQLLAASVSTKAVD